MLRDIFRTIPIYSEDLLPALVVILVICLLEWVVSRRLGYRRTSGHLVGQVVFAIYLLILIQMTVPFSQVFHTLRTQGFAIMGSVELEPFREIYNFWHYGSRKEILVNLVGNVAVFIPMGLLPPLLWKCFRKPWLAWLWWLGPPIVVETLQLLTPRASTVDDVLLNASGALLGYLLYWLLHLLGAGEWCVLKKET